MSKISERIKKVSASPTLAISAKAKAMKKQGIDVVSFGAGEPDFDTPEHIKKTAINAIEGGFTKYTPASGILELKEAIVKKFERDNGLKYTKEEIIISCGAKHVLYNIFQVICDKGDNVIVLSPFWVSYSEMIKLAGAEPILVKTKEEDNFVPNPADIEKAINEKTKAIIVNSPNNPTGSVYPKEVLEAISKIAVKKDILIISDEVYEKILYNGSKHVSMAGLGEKVNERTITVNAVSKTYSMTGWRIGYAGGPKEIIGAISKLQSHSTSNPTSFAQSGSVSALLENQDCINTMLKAFSERRDFTINKLKEIKGLTFSVPKGAFYIMLNISSFLGGKYKTAQELATGLLDEAKVAIVPCEGFDAPEYLRLSFAISKEQIGKGLDRIKSFLEKL